MSNEIRVVISADSAAAEKAIDRVEEAIRSFVASAGKASQGASGVKTLDVSIQRAGQSARYTTEQMRNLSYQVTDIVTGLATGQNPLFVLLQQGGQLKDVFGGVVPALRAVASVFTVMRVAVGGGTAALSLFAVAAYQGYTEAKELDRYLALTGNRANVTRGQFNVMAQDVSVATRSTIGSVREVANELLRTGEFTSRSLGAATSAATNIQKLTGGSAEETAKIFDGISANVTAWSIKANKAYEFLTRAQVDQIRTLQAQGRTQDAVTLSAGLLAEAMQNRVAPATGYLSKALETGARWWSEFWNAAKGAGAPQTAEERIAELKGKVDLVNEAVANGRKRGPIESKRDDVERAELRRLQAIQGASIRSRALFREAQDAENKGILDDSANAISAQVNLDRSGAAQRLAIQKGALEQARRNTERGYEQDLIDASTYQAALYAIDQAALDSQAQFVRAQMALEGKRKPVTPEEVKATAAAQVALQTQLLEIEQQRARLRDEEASGKRDITPKARSVGARDDLRRFEAAERAQEQAVDGQRRNSALQTANDLAATNRQLNVDLIRDDRARGQAQIQIDEKALRARIDLTALSATEQKQVLDDLAAWRLNREKQLNEQLMPVWQRQLEDWKDIHKLMREASEEAMNGVVRNGEDAFVQLVTTGKTSLRTLITDFLAAKARLTYREFVGGGGGGSVLSFLGSFFGGSPMTIDPGGYGITGGSNSLVSQGLGGGRANGGGVGRGSIHPVNERGVPELLTVSGRSYLMMGAESGRVTPTQAGGRGVSISMPLTVNVDSRSDAAQIVQITAAAVQQAKAQMYDELRSARVLG